MVYILLEDTEDLGGSLEDILYALDTLGSIFLVSPQLLEMYQYTARELLLPGRHI